MLMVPHVDSVGGCLGKCNPLQRYIIDLLRRRGKACGVPRHLLVPGCTPLDFIELSAEVVDSFNGVEEEGVSYLGMGWLLRPSTFGDDC